MTKTRTAMTACPLRYSHLEGEVVGLELSMAPFPPCSAVLPNRDSGQQQQQQQVPLSSSLPASPCRVPTSAPIALAPFYHLSSGMGRPLCRSGLCYCASWQVPSLWSSLPICKMGTGGMIHRDICSLDVPAAPSQALARRHSWPGRCPGKVPVTIRSHTGH